MIKEVVLLYRQSESEIQSAEYRVVQEIIEAIRSRDASIRVHFECWNGEDPTDHKGIFAFLQKLIPKLRSRYSGRELVIHASPGTPSMQTIWVLMAETGFIPKPYRIVKSYRSKERRGRGAIADIDLGIETFYKKYLASRPMQVSSIDQAILWEPSRFQSPQLVALYKQAERYARLNVPILILGERGTGKTTLASWIRLNSPFRKEGDIGWPAVACGQYTSETMRSELFGHVAGAFTGAIKDKDGLLSKAHNETLFLDEVGDVSREVQRLLIKALEEKSYYGLGADKPKESNFRLITATNLPWEALIKRLDRDFLDRISMFVLTFPPLRELPDDLGWLWEQVFQTAMKRAGVSPKEISLSQADHDRIVKALKGHSLPGNFRTLYQVAFHLLAALCAQEHRASSDQAIAEATSLLAGDASRSVGRESTETALRLFTERKPLDVAIDQAGVLDCQKLERDFKRYLAVEIKRIAKAKKVSTDQICNVSERTIRNWQGNKEDV